MKLNENRKHNTFAFQLATFECQNSLTDSEARQMALEKEHQPLLLSLDVTLQLGGGFNPFEKYACQNGNVSPISPNSGDN